MSEKLIRQQNSGALINTDYKSLEEYKFKKEVIKDINKMKGICDVVANLEKRISFLEKKIEELENDKD